MSSKLLRIAMAGCVVIGVFACGSTSGTSGSSGGGDASTESGAEAGEAGVDGAPGDEGGSDAAAGDGGECSLAPVGRLCVRGEPTAGGEALTAGGTVTFQVFPKGCFSSSCTEKVQTSCAAIPSGTAFDVTGTFCLRGTGTGACTADCNGGGFANCAQMGVAAGSYEAKLGSLKVSFTVPSALPVGGSCEGSQF